MDEQTAPPSTRVRAAECIINTQPEESKRMIFYLPKSLVEALLAVSRTSTVPAPQQGLAACSPGRCRHRSMMHGVWCADNSVRRNSATGYITPKDMLTGRQQEIHADRDRKLEATREQRQIRRKHALDA